MSLIDNENRIRKLEQLCAAVDSRCNCREDDEETFYHNIPDLEKIIAVRCPVHGRRVLERVSWVPSGMPLRAEDRHLCLCPPCPAREWFEGRRGPLTEEEQERECHSWEEQLSEQGIASFHQDQIKVKRVLQH